MAVLAILHGVLAAGAQRVEALVAALFLEVTVVVADMVKIFAEIIMVVVPAPHPLVVVIGLAPAAAVKRHTH